MAELAPKNRFKITVNLIKALVWPLIVIDQMPGLVKNIETITISGLSIKIRKNDLVKKPSDSVKTVLSRVSPDEIERILNNFFRKLIGIKEMKSGNVGEYRFNWALPFRRNRKADLPNKPGKEYSYGIRPTLEIRKFLV